MDPAIEVRSLRRTFEPTRRQQSKGTAPKVALNDVDLTVNPGTVHSLLGPNGAGKTTLCKIVSTMLLPTAGSANVAGFDVVKETRQARASLGVVLGGERGLYDRLTPVENLMFWAAMYSMPRRKARVRTAELLEKLGLTGVENQRVETFSRGMKQRLHLARGLIADQPLLILDEPTVGMDPVAANGFRALIRDLRFKGKTILLTTHNMEEAGDLSDRLSFIDGGRIIAEGTPSELMRSTGSGSRLELPDLSSSQRSEILASIEPLDAQVSEDGTGGLVLVLEEQAVMKALTIVAAAGVSVFSVTPPSLDDLYVNLVGDRGMSLG
ncbi:daunorubicin resistance protein DrrA family ABC transporter ATP-binding protein [Arthrobacter tecti]